MVQVKRYQGNKVYNVLSFPAKDAQIRPGNTSQKEIHGEEEGDPSLSPLDVAIMLCSGVPELMD